MMSSKGAKLRLFAEFAKVSRRLGSGNRLELLEFLVQGERGVDVRSREGYAAGHLPGAINVPLSEIDEYADTMPREREIVPYRRGPFCVRSFEAVARVRKKGLHERVA